MIPHRRQRRVRPVRRGIRRVLTAAVAFVCIWIVRPGSAVAVDDPTLDRETLQTEHFYVHYPDKLRGFARRTAEVAEEAHEIMTPLLGENPEGRTHIVVNDDVDTANGSANVFGRRIIRVFAMPPAPSGVLGYYTDWLRILVYHEYAHILHLTTESDILETLNTVVGDVLHPNALLPSWYVEGLAVMYESRLTGSGRNHSSLFQMWLRAAALDDELFSIGTVSGSPISWPQGTAPYLYGGSFLEYIVDRHGLEFARKFNQMYGQRAVPYALNVTARRAGGDTFHRMWRD